MLDGLAFLHYLHNFLLNDRSLLVFSFLLSQSERSRPLGDLSHAQARGL